MTVRRYSTTSNHSGLTVREEIINKNRQSNSELERLHEEIQHGIDVIGEAEKVNNRHSLQEYVHKNRYKANLERAAINYHVASVILVICFSL